MCLQAIHCAVSIDDANRRASNTVVAATATKSSVGLVSSFISEESRDELSTAEPLSQESRTSLNTDSNTTAMVQESEISMDDLLSGYRTPVKFSSKLSKRSRRSQ